MSGAPLLLVTVGTDHHTFGRLMDWLDNWLAAGGRERVRPVVQHGATRPPRRELVGPSGAVPHLDYDRLQELMAQASIFVCHAGAATIMEARRLGRLPIIVAREAGLGEIVDGHQARFARRIGAEGIAVNCESEADLHAALNRAVAHPEDFTIPEALDPTAISEPIRRTAALIDNLITTHTKSRHNTPTPSAPYPGAPDPFPPGGSAPSLFSPSGDAGGEPSDPAAWPDVSVVIATRDRPELLRTTLASVRRQDYPGNVRVVLVYDQAQPERALANPDPRRGLTVTVNSRTPGLAGARNTGVLAADGELVAFCDDDDVWRPGKLTAQVRALLATPGASFVSCGIAVRYDGETVERPLNMRRVELADLLRSRLTELHSSTFVMRREALLSGFGLVCEEVPGSYGEDYELLLRAARAAPLVNVPEVGVDVLWHKKSYFTQRWATIATALEWLLDRYPEFATAPSGYARVAGQIAFANAARGERTAALRWTARTIRRKWREPRAYLAVAVAAGVISPDRVLSFLHRRGRGI
jgi:UDP-N-acetylglucosamine transferase subunit ALG13